MTNSSNLREVFASLLLDIKLYPTLSNYEVKISINEMSLPVLTVEDIAKKNICIITYSRGSKYFRVEHFGGLENTSFLIKATPELVLTSIIPDNDEYTKKVLEVLEKAFKYDTVYSQWLSNTATPKIVAYSWENNKLMNIMDSEVLYKKFKVDGFLVTNKRNQTYEFTKEEFLEKFQPL